MTSAPKSCANLTADDLKELGVAAIGHRRRLLEAIAKLRLETRMLMALFGCQHDQTITRRVGHLPANAASLP